MTRKNLTKITPQLLLIFCLLKKKETYPVSISKNSSKREKKFTLLMIPNGEVGIIWQ